MSLCHSYKTAMLLQLLPSIQEVLNFHTHQSSKHYTLIICNNIHKPIRSTLSFSLHTLPPVHLIAITHCHCSQRNHPHITPIYTTHSIRNILNEEFSEDGFPVQLNLHYLNVVGARVDGPYAIRSGRPNAVGSRPRTCS